MPKVAKASKLRRVARREASSAPLPVPLKSTAGGEKNSTDEPDTPAKQELSRGQRKRQAKREQYLRRERLILSSLKLKAEEEQKKRIDGLDALRDALLKTTENSTTTTTVTNDISESSKADTVKSNKSKKQLMTREVNHFNLVLQHPAYKSDPFTTMQEHLRNTLAKQKIQQEVQSEQRSKEEKTRKEEQTRLKKEQVTTKKKRKKFKATRSKTR